MVSYIINEKIFKEYFKIYDFRERHCTALSSFGFFKMRYHIFKFNTYA